MRGAPQGLGLFLPAADTSDMLFIAKHGFLPYLPRATRILLQQVLCPHKQGQPLHVMINEGASMLYTYSVCEGSSVSRLLVHMRRLGTESRCVDTRREWPGILAFYTLLHNLSSRPNVTNLG